MSKPLEISIAQVPQDVELPTHKEVKVPKTSIDILYPTPGTVGVHWHLSLQRAFEYDRKQGWNNIRNERAMISGANISKARNKLVTQALNEGDSEWLFFVDTDMVLEEDTIPRLLCAAQMSGADIIGGLCVFESDDGPLPTIYQLGNFEKKEVTRVLFDYPEDKIVQVAATGTACLLVKRTVFEHIQEENPNNPFPWFREDVLNGHWISEDIMFCLMANSYGHPIFVDCSTPVGHQKGRKIWYPKDVKSGQGFPDEKNIVIIPAKDRLDLTSSLVKQLRDQGEADQVIICDNGSGKKTKNWLTSQNDLVVLDMPDAGIHEMWNQGAKYAMGLGQNRNVNLFFLNNDINIGENFISNLAKSLRSERTIMAMSANYDGRAIEGEFEPTSTVCGARYDGTGGFGGFAFAVKIEFFTSGYLFPEECSWWYGDDDLVNSVRYAGGQIGISSRATCEHIDGGGKTGGDAGWTDPKWDQMKKDDREAFLNKWSEVAEKQKEMAA